MAWWRSAEGAISLQTGALMVAVLLPEPKSPLGALLWQTGYPYLWIVALGALAVVTVLTYRYDLPFLQVCVMFIGIVVWVALDLLLLRANFTALFAIGASNIFLYFGAFFIAARAWWARG